ncbi:hypothetical protein SAMN04487886_12602, partial [Clostridium sp. DSM 8431]
DLSRAVCEARMHGSVRGKTSEKNISEVHLLDNVYEF